VQDGRSVQERRQYPRINLHTELWLGEGGVFTRTMARLTDVSLRGARIVSNDAYQVGSILSVRFRIRTGFITATASVRNVHSGGIGIEFLDLSPEHKDRLEAFILSGEFELRV